MKYAFKIFKQMMENYYELYKYDLAKSLLEQKKVILARMKGITLIISGKE